MTTVFFAAAELAWLEDTCRAQSEAAAMLAASKLANQAVRKVPKLASSRN